MTTTMTTALARKRDRETDRERIWEKPSSQLAHHHQQREQQQQQRTTTTERRKGREKKRLWLIQSDLIKTNDWPCHQRVSQPFSFLSIDDHLVADLVPYFLLTILFSLHILIGWQSVDGLTHRKAFGPVAKWPEQTTTTRLVRLLCIID